MTNMSKQEQFSHNTSLFNIITNETFNNNNNNNTSQTFNVISNKLESTKAFFFKKVLQIEISFL